MKYLLNLIYILISIFLIPKWIFRLLGDTDFRMETSRKLNWKHHSQKMDGPVWLHAASVGEVALLKPLLDRLKSNHPKLRILISTYTSDGYRYAEHHYPEFERILFPYDLSWTMKQAIKRFNPRLIILSELELWPNFLLAAKKNNVPVVVINSRMNDKDYRYFQRIHFLMKNSLSAVKWWGAQTESDANRIKSLIPENQCPVQVTGSMKYDLDKNCHRPEKQITRETSGYKENDLILVAGSTHDPEESILLSVYSRLKETFEHLKLILVPRHPSRATEIAVKSEELCLETQLFSDKLKNHNSIAPVLIVDQFGLLQDFWKLCDFAFVGGSLEIDHGGQNMIEPAAMGKPTCFGNSVYNFQQTADLLSNQDAAAMISCESDLYDVLYDWISTPAKAIRTGERAAEIIQTQRGATQLTYEAIRKYLTG